LKEILRKSFFTVSDGSMFHVEVLGL